MERDIFFVWERVFAKQLIVQNIPGHDQQADIHTKTLSPTKLLFLRSKLAVVDLQIVSPHPTPQSQL